MNNKEVMVNMLSVIRTAMITIIISFTSGVLLDLYKNVAPRIVCKMIRCKNSNSNDSNIKEYDLTIKNVSKKTIHNLNVHVQSETLCESFKLSDESITYGLKFDMSEEENIYSINIPFLSKNDEFTAKLFLDDSHNIKNKPVIVLRSPDNFKKVDTLKYKLQNGDSSFKKKALITAISLILIIFAGVITVNLLNNSTKEIDEPAIESVEENTTKPEENMPVNGTSKDSNKKTPSKNKTNTNKGGIDNTNNSDVNKKENSEESKDSSTGNENSASTSKQEGSSEENTSSNKNETTNGAKVDGNTNVNSSSNTSSNKNSSSENKGTNSNTDSTDNSTSKSIE